MENGQLRCGAEKSRRFSAYVLATGFVFSVFLNPFINKIQMEKRLRQEFFERTILERRYFAENEAHRQSTLKIQELYKTREDPKYFRGH